LIFLWEGFHEFRNLNFEQFLGETLGEDEVDINFTAIWTRAFYRKAGQPVKVIAGRPLGGLWKLCGPEAYRLSRIRKVYDNALARGLRAWHEERNTTQSGPRPLPNQRLTAARRSIDAQTLSSTKAGLSQPDFSCIVKFRQERKVTAFGEYKVILPQATIKHKQAKLIEGFAQTICYALEMYELFGSFLGFLGINDRFLRTLVIPTNQMEREGHRQSTVAEGTEAATPFDVDMEPLTLCIELTDDCSQFLRTDGRTNLTGLLEYVDGLTTDSFDCGRPFPWRLDTLDNHVDSWKAYYQLMMLSLNLADDIESDQRTSDLVNLTGILERVGGDLSSLAHTHDYRTRSAAVQHTPESSFPNSTTDTNGSLRRSPDQLDPPSPDGKVDTGIIAWCRTVPPLTPPDSPEPNAAEIDTKSPILEPGDSNSNIDSDSERNERPGKLSPWEAQIMLQALDKDPLFRLIPVTGSEMNRLLLLL
jgi:hypothetical protein